MQRRDPQPAAAERTTIEQFLDYQRATLLQKTEGLDAYQMNRRLPTSALTLSGLLKHLALVEDHWFGPVFLGREQAEVWRAVDWEADEDWEWHSAVDDSPAALRDLFEASVEASDEVVREALARPEGLDALSVRESRQSGGRFSLRWILVHMVEEYARHNGHADLIRESIDGQTGE